MSLIPRTPSWLCRRGRRSGQRTGGYYRPLHATSSLLIRCPSDKLSQQTSDTLIRPDSQPGSFAREDVHSSCVVTPGFHRPLLSGGAVHEAPFAATPSARNLDSPALPIRAAFSRPGYPGCKTAPGCRSPVAHPEGVLVPASLLPDCSDLGCSDLGCSGILVLPLRAAGRGCPSRVEIFIGLPGRGQTGLGDRSSAKLRSEGCDLGLRGCCARNAFIAAVIAIAASARKFWLECRAVFTLVFQVMQSA